MNTNNENRSKVERAVRTENQNIENHLDEIIKKANKALERLLETGTANYVDSNINGIGSDFQELIRSIERKNTYQQMIDYVFTVEIESK